MNVKQTLIMPNGFRLSYAQYGDRDGYPILIQHGLIASIDDYELFDRLIQSRTRLICIARPGYGESSPFVMSSFAEWADLAGALIQELGLAQFDVLGMSSGAPYSYAIGSKFPAKVGRIFIFSGIPALYDEIVLSKWPYAMAKNSSIADMKALARELFFSNLTQADLQRNDIRDSLMNDGFGVAQDLKLRSMIWGFRLSDVKCKVFMQHSQCDEAVPFRTATRTSELLPNCQFELLENGPHFSNEALDNFIKHTVINNLR